MFKPTEDRLLVEVREEKEGLLALPEGAERDKLRVGRVISIGDKVDIRAGSGTKIVFERYGPIHLKQFNENWFLVKQQYVLGICD